MKAALESALRHAATALAGALGAIQFDPLDIFSVGFGKAALASLIGAALAGAIRFLSIIGAPQQD